MRIPPRAAVIVVGLGYGDESKGATVDHLAATIPDAAAVVRWSGGAQAAHNVRHGDRHHTFRQFGSGTFLDLRTILRAPAMIEPLMLAEEADELERLGVRDPLGLILADADALVTTPIHRALNRAREIARGAARHGSCGVGIGETRAYELATSAGARQGDVVGNFTVPSTPAAGARAPRVGDLRDPASLTRALDQLMRYAAPLLAMCPDQDAVALGSLDEMARALSNVASHLRIREDVDADLSRALEDGTVVFEGSQGVLLDEWYGFHPHTTWSTISPRALRAELVAAGRTPFVLGATRTYATRHGAGPLPTEDPALEHAEPDNGTGRYQGQWRQGHLDLPALRYAVEVSGGVDAVAVSHLDAVGTGLRVATAYRRGAGTSDQPLEAAGPTTLAAASRRTRLMEAAEPVYPDAPQDVAAVLALIEGAAAAPILVTADGPAREHRRYA